MCVGSVNLRSLQKFTYSIIKPLAHVKRKCKSRFIEDSRPACPVSRIPIPSELAEHEDKPILPPLAGGLEGGENLGFFALNLNISQPLIQSNYPSSYHSKTLESPHLLYFTAAIFIFLSLLSRLCTEKQ